MRVVTLARAAVLVSAAALAACSSAPPAPAATASSSVAPVDAKAAFAKMKGLAGTWEGGIGKPDGPKGQVVYRVTGHGTAVMETQFPGTPHEMVTVYHLDGNDLVLTHYCAAGNQPRMKLVRATDAELEFDFTGGANLDVSKDFHMHSATIRFVAPDRIESTWFGWGDGKPDPAGIGRFYLSRKPG